MVDFVSEQQYTVDGGYDGVMPRKLDDLEKAIVDVFGKTLAMEQDPLFDRESAMGHRGLKKFRGVTKHKRTQRYEAHIWESKKQIYLGGFESELLAARSHDIMALKCKGPFCEALNFDRGEYDRVMVLLDDFDKDDIICCLRNYSKAYGVGGAVHHHHHHRSGGHHGNFRLSVTKGKGLCIKKKHAPVRQEMLPFSPKQHACVMDALAPITPQFGAAKEPVLFDPVQPVDALCSQGVFLSGGKSSTATTGPNGEQSPFASYAALDESYIIDSFSSEASHGMDFGDVYEPESDSVNLALTTSVALHDDDALVPWLD